MQFNLDEFSFLFLFRLEIVVEINLKKNEKHLAEYLGRKVFAKK